MSKISLIIPVYNVEKYLTACLDSAINQSLKDIEIIIVNDGSTDNSYDIIKSYATKDDRIIVINQSNMGLSTARNNAIKRASSDFIAFLDSDDFMNQDFLEKMYQCAEETNSDIVVCKHTKVYESNSINPLAKLEIRLSKITQSRISLSTEKALHRLIRDITINNYAWDKIYRRSLFTDNEVFYPEGLYFEDMPTCIRLFYYANKISFIRESLYNYTIRENSITQIFHDQYVKDLIQGLTIVKKFLINKEVFESYKKDFCFLCNKNYLYLYSNIKKKYDIHKTQSKTNISDKDKKSIELKYLKDNIGNLKK